MCGIIGITAIADNTVQSSVEGLKRLEYRGYDSAGVASIEDGKIACVRAEGKISVLERALEKRPLKGSVSIGHTRWATHGSPSLVNAHPHCRERVAVIHNGIIENFYELRENLTSRGYRFDTETDTEVVPVLLSSFLDAGKTPFEAVQAMLGEVEGAFALGIIFRDEPNRIYAARRGSPLAIGYGDKAKYIASDSYALAPFTSKVCYLQDGDYAILEPGTVRIFNSDGVESIREVKSSSHTADAVGKGEYRHFMLKEIYEQPTVIGETIHNFYNPVQGKMHFSDPDMKPEDIQHIMIVACGTSYYAGMVAKYWFEQIAQIPASMDIASEFRYGGRLLPEKGGLAVFISQSGETADTYAALQYAKEKKQRTISVVNAPESSMERDSHMTLHTHAGPEIGVASTKAFTTQLTVLAGLALEFAQARGSVTPERYRELANNLMDIPSRIAEALHLEEEIQKIAQICVNAQHMFYVGRGVSFPIAMEGALKLKEISYIHAEGFAAGELKHGPIALIDEGTPVVVVIPHDRLFDKTFSNLKEIAARGARIIAITDRAGAAKLRDEAEYIITLADIDEALTPVLFAVPVQLLAYHIALLKGTDIDQPRNLAKSVTVE